MVLRLVGILLELSYSCLPAESHLATHHEGAKYACKHGNPSSCGGLSTPHSIEDLRELIPLSVEFPCLGYILPTVRGQSTRNEPFPRVQQDEDA